MDDFVTVLGTLDDLSDDMTEEEQQMLGNRIFKEVVVGRMRIADWHVQGLRRDTDGRIIGMDDDDANSGSYSGAVVPSFVREE